MSGGEQTWRKRAVAADTSDLKLCVKYSFIFLCKARRMPSSLYALPGVMVILFDDGRNKSKFSAPFQFSCCTGY